MTPIQQYSLTPTASRRSTKTMKSTRVTIRRRTRRIQSKTSPVEKGRFRLAESECVRNGLSLISLLELSFYLFSHTFLSQFFFSCFCEIDYLYIYIILVLAPTQAVRRTILLITYIGHTTRNTCDRSITHSLQR